MGQGLLRRPCADSGKVGLSVTGGLWLFGIGIAQVALWPRLPGLSTALCAVYFSLVLVLLLAAVLVARRGYGRPSKWLMVRGACYWLLPFLIGAGWGLYWDRAALDARLPPALHGTDFEVTLQITSLPESRPAVFRYGRGHGSGSTALDVQFLAEVESAEHAALVGQKVLVSWYGSDRIAEIRAGSRWTMRLRLKRPRGSVNPHTFDYEAWLLQEGVFATGYIREKALRPVLLEDGAGLYRLRESIRDRVTAANLGFGRLLRALLLGDKSGLTDTDRKVLQSTGTAHLLAISGLHVGMVAGFFLLIGGYLGRLLSPFGSWNSRLLAGSGGLAAAAGYTLICGAPLSAQRALIMTAVAISVWIWGRRVASGLAFALAVAMVLLLQPLAVLNPGFWLSFLAVAALLLCYSGRTVSGPDVFHASESRSTLAKLLSYVGQYIKPHTIVAVRSQWVVILALLLPSLLFFSGASASALLVNLVAIPWMGLLILPSIMLGAVMPMGISGFCWQFADWQLALLMRFLHGVDGRFPSWQWLTAPGWWVVGLALVSVLILMLPRGFPGRLLGWCMLPVVLAPALPWRSQEPTALSVTVLDVGQGLAVAVASDDQYLVLDTGAGISGGWSAGSSVVAPYLVGEGATEIAALVVSHGDRDHAGGAAGLAEVLPVSEVIAPGDLGARLAGTFPRPTTSTGCTAGERLSVADLNIQWLWPPASPRVDGEENDHSCVALLDWRGVRILFTGDISRKVERRLAALYPDFAPVDLLIVPHHGSRTSSSATLLDWSQPARAVFSAGYRHHFSHPHPAVVQRLSSRGVKLSNTADAGAVRFLWLAGSVVPEVYCARDSGRFWRTLGPLSECG